MKREPPPSGAGTSRPGTYAVAQLRPGEISARVRQAPVVRQVTPARRRRGGGIDRPSSLACRRGALRTGRSAPCRAGAVVRVGTEATRLVRAAVAPTSRSSTSSRRRRPGAGTVSPRARGELERRGLEVELNRLGRDAGMSLQLVQLRRRAAAALRACGARMVHRVDGPIGVYRGFDDGTDGDRRAERGARGRDGPPVALQPREAPRARPRAPLPGRDPERARPGALPPASERAAARGQEGRLIATSWSDNVRKGAETLSWLDRHLDLDRYELTFVGRAPVRFERSASSAPSPRPRSRGCSGSTTSTSRRATTIPARTPCSRRSPAGCPAAYLESGGHPELVGDAGLPFARTRSSARSRPARRRARRAASGDHVPSLAEVADRYLAVLGLRGRRLESRGRGELP